MKGPGGVICVEDNAYDPSKSSLAHYESA
jgi:hypothetical protein